MYIIYIMFKMFSWLSLWFLCCCFCPTPALIPFFFSLMLILLLLFSPFFSNNSFIAFKKNHNIQWFLFCPTSIPLLLFILFYAILVPFLSYIDSFAYFFLPSLIPFYFYLWSSSNPSFVLHRFLYCFCCCCPALIPFFGVLCRFLCFFALYLISSFIALF